MTTTNIYVDVIIPVHNASKTIEEAVSSSMNQVFPPSPSSSSSQHSTKAEKIHLDVAVCCYDDGSQDDSLRILQKLKKEKYSNDFRSDDDDENKGLIVTRLLIGSATDDDNDGDGKSRGAGYARNRAASLRHKNQTTKQADDDNGADHSFLCLLDADDIMHPTRIVEQVTYMLHLNPTNRHKTLLGCTFDRQPKDSTWHYTEWANNLLEERLYLERFREITVLQPTWMMTRRRFEDLGGYIEAPPDISTDDSKESNDSDTAISQPPHQQQQPYKLIHPQYDTSQTLRLAEDLRLFHAHLQSSGQLKLHRTSTPLVTYRHTPGMTQSSRTPRKLLLQLRTKAFEDAVLFKESAKWMGEHGFIVWGAGRDGKEFVKSLRRECREKVVAFVDVDEKKIHTGFYVNKELGVKIPIVHFSLVAKDDDVRRRLQKEWVEGGGSENDFGNDAIVGRIDKGRKRKGNDVFQCDEKDPNDVKQEAKMDTTSNPPPTKRRKLHNISSSSSLRKGVGNGSNGISDFRELEKILPNLPIVVCVAMYRTNGVLEKNVRSVGRTEGEDLWHFS